MLENHRLFAQDGYKKLQKHLRKQLVFGNKVGKQNMTLPQFYLSIAKIFGILKAKLAPNDKPILHDPSLEVFYNHYNNREFNLTLIYFRLFRVFTLMLLHQMFHFSMILKFHMDMVKVSQFFLDYPRKTICGLPL